MQVDITCYPGFVYKLDSNTIIVYDSTGIGLRLSERILAQLARDAVAGRTSRYLDQKGRQFTFTVQGEQMVFDVKNGELIHVDGHLLYPPLEKKLPHLHLVT